MPYATGKYSNSLCDICGQKCAYTDLKQDIYNQKWTGLLVCPECVDRDSPQLWIGQTEARPEGIALQLPRPDNPDWVSRGWVSWNPVQGMTAQLTPGVVTVSVT